MLHDVPGAEFAGVAGRSQEDDIELPVGGHYCSGAVGINVFNVKSTNPSEST